jgi:hypothetical protein
MIFFRLRVEAVAGATKGYHKVAVSEMSSGLRRGPGALSGGPQAWILRDPAGADPTVRIAV